jgi:hypothetical protein
MAAVQYSENCLSQMKVDSADGTPSTVAHIKIKEHTDQRIRDNPRMSTDESVSEMSISHGKKRIKNCLRFN